MMERKTKICGVCQKETVMWKSRTRDHPQMCQTCWQQCQSKPGMLTPVIFAVQERQLGAIKQSKQKEDKSIPELLKLAEIVCNRFIRKRDTLSDGTFKCISCNLFFSSKEMDAGHYRSKKYASTRFHQLNIHGQCISCNRMKDGNEKQYRINLIEKIGLPLVEYIEDYSRQPWKWDKQEILNIISSYK